MPRESAPRPIKGNNETWLSNSKIFGPVRERGRKNEELSSLYGDSDLEKVIKLRRLRVDGPCSKDGRLRSSEEEPYKYVRYVLVCMLPALYTRSEGRLFHTQGRNKLKYRLGRLGD